MTRAMLVMAVPIEQFPDNRQLTLWSSCSTTIALFGASHSANRVEATSSGLFFNGHSNLENALVVDVDYLSTVEGTAQQTSPMAHIKSETCVQRAH